MRLILFSNLDLAGVNIARNLASITGLKPVQLDELEGSQKGEFHLVEIEGSLVDLELRGDGIEWALCLSKHKSSSGMGCLTAHTPGNPAFTAALGGRPNSLGVSNPPLQSMLIRELKNECATRGVQIDVTLEATHHGPTDLAFPVTFVEIGSDEQCWCDPLLGEVVANAVFRSLVYADRGVNAIAIGGGHYPEKFTRLVLSGEYDVGHIVPKYVLASGYDPDIFRKCLGRTAGRVRYALVDWKGVPSSAKEMLKDEMPSLGVELVRV